MKRPVVLALALLPLLAQAGGIDGVGRVSLGPGFRWIPNWYFHDRAREQGTPIAPGPEGGPDLAFSFGYGVTRIFEVTIDLLGGWQPFTVQQPTGDVAYNAWMGSGLLGLRVVGSDVLFRGFMPYLCVQAGPLFSSIQSDHLSEPAERLALGASAGAGFDYRFGNLGLGLDVRYLYSRAIVPGISGMNVGGVLFGLHFTIFVPASAKQELDVPGF